MKRRFLEGFTLGGAAFRLAHYLIPTALNVGLIHFAAWRSQAVGDTDWLTIPILLVCMVGSAACLIESIGRLSKVFVWQNGVYFAVSLFNVVYFFAIFTCCVVSVGSML